MEVEKGEGRFDTAKYPPHTQRDFAFWQQPDGRGNPRITPSLLHGSLLPITFSFNANMQPDIHKEIELGSTSLQNQIKLPLGCFITLFTTEKHFSGICNLL